MSMVHEIVEGVIKNKKNTRKGRGHSQGKGKTSGRGHKGSKARTGTYIKRGYEGGQTPLFQRFPKRGFSNYKFTRKSYIVNLQDLNMFDDGTTVDQAALQEKGLIPDTKLRVKILGEGKLTKKVTVVAGWYSKPAHAAIVESGSTAQNEKGQTFEFPKPKKKFVKREKVKKGDTAPLEPEAAAPSA